MADIHAQRQHQQPERIRPNLDGDCGPTTKRMTELDVRDIKPMNRHPKIHDAFEDLAPGESLTIVNDHEPKPLFYEFEAEVDSFDADGYEVERVDAETFRATFPKAEA